MENNKKQKVDNSDTKPMPSSIIVNFTDQLNERSVPIDIPTDSSNKQLELLVNSLLGNSSDNKTIVPYAFYITTPDSGLIEITNSLKETLSSINLTNFESALTINYQPLSIYRVRPLTRCTDTLTGHSDSVLHVNYSPDGRRLASGGGDMAVRFWNTITATPTFVCAGHRHHVLCTIWTPDGKTFISADRSGEIRCWDPNTGLQKGKALTSHTQWVTSLSIEPFHSNPVNYRLASGSKDRTIKIWSLTSDSTNYSLLATISGHTDSVEDVIWGGKGLIYSCSRDRTIKVWAVDGHGLNQHLLVRTLTGHGHRVNAMSLNCSFVLRTAYNELGKQIAKDASIDELREIAQKRYDQVTGSDGEVLVSGSDDFTMYLWRPSVDKHPIVRLMGHQQLINHVIFSPDGRYIASASFDKKVKIWCGKTGRFLHTLLGHVGSVYQVSWSGDSNYLVSASKDSTVKIWSMSNTKAAIHTLSGHEDEVYALDWSPDGSQLASGSKDRTIKIWKH